MHAVIANEYVRAGFPKTLNEYSVEGEKKMTNVMTVQEDSKSYKKAKTTSRKPSNKTQVLKGQKRGPKKVIAKKRITLDMPDPTVDLLNRMKEETGAGTIAEVVRSAIVVYAKEIVEQRKVRELLGA